VESQGEKKWLIQFNNGEAKECPSTGLRLLLVPIFSITTPNIEAATSIAVLGLTAAALSVAVLVMLTSIPVAANNDVAVPSVLVAEAANIDGVAPSTSVPETANNDGAVPSVSFPVTANIDGVVPSTVPVAANISAMPSELDDDPDAVDLAEQSEEVLEGKKYEDKGFSVVENIT
jgi:hypothetical protein